MGASKQQRYCIPPISRLHVGTQLYYDSDAWQVRRHSASPSIITAPLQNFEFRNANFEMPEMRHSRSLSPQFGQPCGPPNPRARLSLSWLQSIILALWPRGYNDD